MQKKKNQPDLQPERSNSRKLEPYEKPMVEGKLIESAGGKPSTSTSETTPGIGNS